MIFVSAFGRQRDVIVCRKEMRCFRCEVEGSTSNSHDGSDIRRPLLLVDDEDSAQKVAL
jgi:hypothetical protein